MALFMIFYKGKHTQLGDNQMGDNQKRGTQKGGTHVANYNIGYSSQHHIYSLI